MGSESMGRARAYLSTLAPRWGEEAGGAEAAEAVKRFLAWSEAKEVREGVFPEIEASEAHLRASGGMRAKSVALDVESGSMHLRLDVPDGDASRLLEVVDSVAKGLASGGSVSCGGSMVELWNRNGRKGEGAVYGIRVSDASMTLDATVGWSTLLDFADQIEDRIG